MGAFLVYIIKSSLCVLAFYLGYKILLSRDTFHRLNRILILSCLALSLLIPLVHLSIQETTLVNTPMLNLETILMQGNLAYLPDTQIEVSWNGMAIVLLVYLLGASFFLFRMGWSIYKLMQLLKKSKLVKKTNDYTLIVHQEQDLNPFSWMNYMILPEKDYDNQAFAIVEHEKAHIRYQHSWDLVLANLCCLMQWFNPAIWLLKLELQNIHEYEADDYVLNQGIDAKTYQLLLIKKAAGSRLYSLANSLNHNSLKKRIAMMLTKKSSSWARAKYLFVLPVSVLAVTAFAHPEVMNLSQEIEVVTVDDLTATISQATEKVTNDPTKIFVIVQEEKKDTVYQVVDQAPEFPGGTSALMQFLGTNMKYPAEAAKAGIGGRVIVQFVITKDGTIQNPTVVRSADPMLDAEALRVVSSMPKWTPGKLKGANVNVRYTLPIAFRPKVENPVVPAQSTATGQMSVEGTVVDMQSNPIVGANVIIEGTPEGTITDTKGHFRLSVQEGQFLLIGLPIITKGNDITEGYAYQRIPVKGNNIGIVQLKSVTKD